jgi:dihydrofolate synthase/folylpolyglutamate synthase
MPRSYEQTLDFLYGKLPYFSRDGKKALKLSLDNSLQLSEKTGNPHLKFPSIHVGGTNGKGSVSHSLASVFQHSHYKTGLYTSPHLVDFRERIRINGKMIPKEKVIAYVEEFEPWMDSIQASFFEITQAIAFKWFAEQHVDIAIIEVGLGGRLDSTNIINPTLSIITNISYDHQDMLGDTLEAIAKEKAGIIKPNIPVLIGRRQIETEAVFIEKAKSTQSPLYFAEDIHFHDTLYFELSGIYQKENLQTLRAAFQILSNHCAYELPAEAIQKGLETVGKTTGLRGRWETLQPKNPKIIADTGHNEEGLYFVNKQLQAEQYENLHIVMGMVSDKTRDKLWNFFPKEATYYFCKPAIPRGLDPVTLQLEAKDYGLNGNVYSSCSEAFRAATEKAGEKDLIFIGASTFVVAEILPHFPLEAEK